MRKSKILILILTTVFLTSCATDSIDWTYPSAVTDSSEQKSLLPTQTELKRFSSLETFTSAEFDWDVMLGFNFDGIGDSSLQVDPLSCLGTEKYLLTDDFWLTPTSSSTRKMGNGYSERYVVQGENQQSLRIAIFADKNVENANLIGDIAAELKNCKTVTNIGKEMEWTSTFNFTAASPDQLRVEIDTEYSKSNGEKYNGRSIKLVRQVGRNMLSVMLSNTAKSGLSLNPISTEQENDLMGLLEIFASKVSPQK